MKHVKIHWRQGCGLYVHISKSVSQVIRRLAHGRVVSWGWADLSLFNRLQQVPLRACKLSRGSQARAAATRSLVGLVCCKLKEIYALYENFIYIGPLPVLSLGRGSVPGLMGLMGLTGLAVIHDNMFLKFLLLIL